MFAGSAVLRLRENLDREPDLFLVSEARRSQVTEMHVQVPVDLVIEVTSPGSESRDLEEKREEYERAGIPEYWVVDPIARVVHVHSIEGKRYRIRKLTEGRLGAASLPGLHLRIEWFRRSPLPSTKECLEGSL